MPDQYGERFIEAGQFAKYCRDLNVGLGLHELEGYEQSGRLLPVMRVVYPAEYAEQKRRGLSPNPRRWPAIARLIDPTRHSPDDFRNMPDTELIHPFDREIGLNSLLIRPAVGDYLPWNTHPIFSVERYYSYWQVHRLYALKHASANMDWEPFDWLSFWVTMYKQEQMRISKTEVLQTSYADFGSLPVVLTGETFKAYRRRLKEHAGHIRSRFGLATESYYHLLRQLIDMYEDYRRYERYKLASEIRKDVLCLADLICSNTDVSWHEISDKVATYGRWYRYTFRNFDLATKERDAARRVLTGIRIVDEIKNESNSISKEEIEKAKEVDTLLDYCQINVSLLITALSGMEAIGYQEFQEKDRAVVKYTNLKNILTSFEYLVRRIKKAARIKSGDTLDPMLMALMDGEPWVAQFIEKRKMTYGSLKKLKRLMADMNLDYTAKFFLITCAARNFTVHNFPEEFELRGSNAVRQSEFYGEVFAEILRAVKSSILYTWRKARAENWVK